MVTCTAWPSNMGLVEIQTQERKFKTLPPKGGLGNCHQRIKKNEEGILEVKILIVGDRAKY